MAATAVIAKTAVTVVSDKRGRAAIGVLICSVIMLFFLPLIVFMGVMGNMNDIQIDTAEAQQMVVQNLSAEDKVTLTHLETVMKNIQTEFEKRKRNTYTVKKAQALYACALFDAEKADPDFISKYADCFEQTGSDDELRAAISIILDLSGMPTPWNIFLPLPYLTAVPHSVMTKLHLKFCQEKMFSANLSKKRMSNNLVLSLRLIG